MARKFDDLGFSEEELRAAAAELPFPTSEELKIQQEKEEVINVSLDNSAVMENARTNLDFLAALALPDVFKYFFPLVYHLVWKWLLEYVHKKRDFSQLALGLPRGFGKTTLIKVFLLYVILFTTRKFIIVFCENQEKANNIVADVMTMLSHPNIKKVFGDWSMGKGADRLDLKTFGFRGRDITFKAGTIETARGINLQNERPDVMLFDDIQSRKMAQSQTVSETLEAEMYGTAMKAKSPHGCLFIFIGNMYPTKWSILRKLKKNKNWVKFIAGGILADGTSLWEDLQPISQLLREFENDLAAGHPEIFYAEVLNDENAQANNLIDLSKLPDYPVQEGDIPGGNAIIIDPATDKVGADKVSIGYFEVHNGYDCMVEIDEGRYSPGETIRRALLLAIKYNCRLVAIESTGYQFTLKHWFEFICTQMQITGIEAVEIYSGSFSKNSRIMTMLKAYAAGEFFISPEARHAAHLQIVQWNPMKRDNDDGILDLLAYMPKVREMYGQYMVSVNLIESQEHASAHVQHELANACF